MGTVLDIGAKLNLSNYWVNCEIYGLLDDDASMIVNVDAKDVANLGDLIDIYPGCHGMREASRRWGTMNHVPICDLFPFGGLR